MKKLTALFLCMIIAVTTVSCGGPSVITNNGKTTLMIYMIGSDLESGSGSGTDDLIEIQDSGVDLENNNVLIYTGGTTEWDNDMTSAEENMILSLSADGYSEEKRTEQTSMGDPATLSDFLNYSVENYPAEHYVLILWDHGGGPMEGYGKDILFENDSLTLGEMSQALEASPFSKDSKLDWVGFDACLMSSAELACVWSDYAGYMVASQEIEPAFGWDYSFLKDLGKKETTELLSGITEVYLDNCLAYYEKKNYKDRDTTLAAMDLSYVSEMRDALNELFSAAYDQIADHYDTLASSRVRTRSPGRASTGSEYDLVDLGDLAQQLKADYPAQADKLSGVIDRMVVCNSTNTGRMCGLSLYYPFFNKSYYENKWNEEYREMKLFDKYLDYLTAYGEIWMDESMMDYAQSGIPSAELGRYKLELDEEQAKHYASAKYYILRRISGDVYNYVYSSPEVSFENNSLSAEFNGNIIYAHNEIGDYAPVIAKVLDSSDGIIHYSIQASLNDSQGTDFISNAFQGENAEKIQPCMFNIAVDSSTGRIDTSTLTPFQSDKSGDVLNGGKIEDIDLAEYTSCVFMKGLPFMITRDENGVIRSTDDWKSMGMFSGFEDFSLIYGLEFLYAPLSSGDYSLIFEICDTQGSTYCSEPIDIDTSGFGAPVVTFEQKKPKTRTIEAECDGNYPVLLAEDDKIAFYLDTIKEEGYQNDLTIYAVNKSDESLYYTVERPVVNGKITCSSFSGMNYHLDAGKEGFPESVYTYNDKPYIDSFSFSDETKIGIVKDISSLSFKLTVNSDTTKETLWNEDTVNVTFREGAHYVPHSSAVVEPDLEREYTPLFGVTVEPGKLADNELYSVELMRCGADSYDYFYQVLRITNKTDSILRVAYGAYAIDDINTNEPVNVAIIDPYCDYYIRRSIKVEDLEKLKITAMHKLSFEFHTEYTVNDYICLGEPLWVDAKLKNPSESASAFKRGDTVLAEKDGVIMALLSSGPHEYNENGKTWYVTIENDSDKDVYFEFENKKVFNADGKEIEDGYLSYDLNVLAPGQRTVVELSASSYKEKAESAEFTVDAYSSQQNRLYYSSDDVIKLK